MQGRRHAAIMFTDIVGYTSLMGADEDRALRLLRENRTIHKRLIRKFQGELIKEMGDGILASFPLASYAVRCAQAILFEAKKQEIPLKIGIHEGEIVYEGNDVFGDGVNIASRLQESSREGCISISGAVYDDVKNKPDIQSRFIREESFKNVDEPVKVYFASCDERSLREFTPEKLEKKTHQRKPFYQRQLLKVSSLILILGLMVIFILFYSGTSLPFEERDWIVISDFENLTEERIFDHSLNTAFSLSINQSRYINVITRQRMMDALKRMNRKNIEYIDEETGREIAIREGVKICVIPSISRVGTRYILTAKIQEAETAGILKSEVLYAANQDEIIRRMDMLSKKIRRVLGESQYKILQQSKPLVKVTTFSLDALKEYSLGIENQLNLEFKKARSHYENAIRFDSGFIAAKASLGNLLIEHFDREKGIEWLNQAILSVDNLTVKEKYGILAFHAANVENDLDKAIGFTKTRMGLYPDDPIPHNNLGWYFQNQGNHEEALKEYKKAIRIDPYMMLPYTGVIWIYIDKSGRIDSAFTWADRMIKHGPDNPWGYFYLGSSYVAKHELQKAKQQFLKASNLSPDFTLNNYRLAHTYRLLGMYDEAIEILDGIYKSDPNEITALYDMGVNYQQMGKDALAREFFKKYLSFAEKWEEAYPDDPVTYIAIGAGLIRLGETAAGWKKVTKGIAMDSTIHFRIAEVLSIQDRKDEALDHLEKAFLQGDLRLAWIRLNPDLQPLHNEPRFHEMVSKYFAQ
ncbi:MAG: tetratricopeptide repeat protein [Cyclobacteriaceae bacterium]|nr:tetratricopeptide repeat protein [Cyclobacteriaceae bacterium]